jgi:hypothetical protein
VEAFTNYETLSAITQGQGHGNPLYSEKDREENGILAMDIRHSYCDKALIL